MQSIAYQYGTKEEVDSVPALTLLSHPFILNSCSLRYLRLLGVLPRAWGGNWTVRGGFQCSSR
jgi:hypothetical protein